MIFSLKFETRQNDVIFNCSHSFIYAKRVLINFIKSQSDNRETSFVV